MLPSSKWEKNLPPLFQHSREGKDEEILNLAAKDVKSKGALILTGYFCWYDLKSYRISGHYSWEKFESKATVLPGGVWGF
jgi:hypothetical protein